MKVQCETCESRYAIADEKVNGRRVNVRCRKCGQIIVVRGDLCGWHVSVDGDDDGPFTFEELRRRVGLGSVDESSFVWREGMDDWRPAAEVAALGELFAGSLENGSVEKEQEPFASPLLAHSVGDRHAALTGSRNENSVLFSLSNLSDLPRRAAESKTPSTDGVNEGSGLIDIRALTRSINPGSASSLSATDELLSIGGSGLGSPLVAPVVLPEPSSAVSKTPIMIGTAFALMMAIIGVVVVATVEVTEATPLAASGERGQARVRQSTPAQADQAPSPSSTGVTATPSSPPSAVEAPDSTPSVRQARIAAPTATAAPPASRAPAQTRARTRARTRAQTRTRTQTRTRAQTQTPSPRSAGSSNDDDPLEAIFAERERRPPTPPTRSLAPTPSRSDVVSAMRSVAAAVRACASGAHGMAEVRFRFGSNGRVASATVPGDALPAATQSCIGRAARAAHVPPFGRDSFSVAYPFRL